MTPRIVIEADDGTVLGPDGWSVDLQAGAPDRGERPGTVRVRYDGTEPAAARIRIELAVPAGTPYWLIPGLFYGDNRDPACTRIYPRYAAGEHDSDTLVADHWAFRSDRAASPVVFGWGDDAGVALSVDPRTPLGLSGLGLGRSRVWASLPYREEPFSYTGEPHGVAPLSASYTWRPGEEHELRFSVWDLGPDRRGFAAVLHRLRARSRQAADPVRPWVDLSTAAELAAYGLHRWHYRPDPPVLIETALFDRELGGEDRLAMHVAWVSGIPYAHALLRHGRRTGTAAYIEAGTAVIDHITENLAPCGLFWGRWQHDTGWTTSWTPVPGGLHARTLAEASLFTLRALAAEPADHPAWTAAARANVDFAVEAQDGAGNLGSLYHAESGEVLSRSGCAGLTWVAALAEGFARFGDPRYLEAARRGGEHHAEAVRTGSLCGAPEDVDLAPSSEDGYAAVLAYLSLHRVDPDPHWLELARGAADWMLTFRYSYDVEFDPATLLGTYGFRSLGADQASPSNQHLHNYGLICTTELLELSTLTRDPSYAEATAEHLRFARQFVARRDGDFNARRGMVTERYYQTECFGPPGAILTLSHSWCIGMLLLACEDALARPEADW